MKLLTLNTHSWQEENQQQKLQVVAEAIIEQGCDVIALQEVNQHSLSLALDNKILGNKQLHADNYGYLLQQKLAELGHDYQLTWDFVHQSYQVYQEGLAFLTRLPIVAHQVIDLNDDYDETSWKHRRAVKITVAYQQRNIDFYNCHCGWWHDPDSLFSDHLNRIMATVSSQLSFLLGDFNSPSHITDEGYAYAIESNLKDCFVLAEDKDSGITVVKNIDGWKQNSQALRLDYIFSNQEVKVKTHKVIFNDDFYPIVSDHFGVIAVVDLAENK